MRGRTVAPFPRHRIEIQCLTDEVAAGLSVVIGRAVDAGMLVGGNELQPVGINECRGWLLGVMNHAPTMGDGGD